LKKVYLYTDGACRGNPGPGGWAAILRYENQEKILYGYEEETTNNRMELMAVLQGLSALKQSCHVTITTDSQYVAHGMTQWIQGWKKKGWKNSKKEPVKNKDLWEPLDEMVEKHEVTWCWVRGHTGHPENELADEYANLAIDEKKRNS